MAMIKSEMSKELVVNVLQQEDGKEGETVQIRIEPGVTMAGSHAVELAGSAEDMEDDNPQDSVDTEGHENAEEVQQHHGAIVLAGGSA
ncbi:hypothetical protein BIW11_13787 [Tropilaelaps mercedesae]|uniref:Uncharacterized protein n=1 Tax=Tropilaelaps mercedesae TaxID=418985 RepID=A0A1V9X0M2_9ACAR|nr:hypothetical protein BIW11_13787 [Tropilaelaps mercedesae]